jgi:phage gp36-like protein
MTYAVQQDLVDRFGQAELAELTDRTNGTTIDTAVLGKALQDADDEINGYLAVRYTVPLASPPLILKRLACDIARYFLYEDRATEIVTQRYKDAVAYLKDVGAGKVSIGVDAANQEPAQVDLPTHDAGDRVFQVGRPSKGTEGTLDDYVL